jgi:hypothetical protein
MLQVHRRQLHQAVAIAHQRTDCADLLLGAKAGAQQPRRVQMLQPLAVADVGLASRHVLHMTRVDQTDLHPACLQNLKQRYPVDSGRLHGHCLDSTLLEPVRGGQQIFSEGGKLTNRMGIAIGGHGDINLRRADVDARRVGVNGVCRRCCAGPGLLPSCWHRVRSCAMPSGPNRAKEAIS